MMRADKINGAHIVLETLYRLGVRHMFGYPGGAVIPIYDELYKYNEEEVKLHHYFVRHEQGAAHAADGYARVSGKVGVCLATSGPGATNLVTGIMTAYVDSIPLLAITGQVGRSLLGKDSFQEADTVGITMPITKNNYLVKDIMDLPRIIKSAYFIASTGRPGPVLIDIPKDIQLQTIPMDVYDKLYDEPITVEGYDPTYKGHIGQIKKAAALLKSAKKPLIIAGGGVLKASAWQELRELAERTQTPVANTLVGLGCFPEDHPLSLGMLGMHGTVAANYATEAADVVIAAGIRFHDRITGDPNHFCPHAKIIHIDIDPAEIDKNVKIHVPIVGDLKHVLTELNTCIEDATHEEWWHQIHEWQETYPMVVPPHDESVLYPQEVLSEVDRIVNGEAIIVTDVGQHQMWAAQFLTFKHPHTMVTSGGAGTMGYGVPAAMGAAIAAPDTTVVLVVGDGGFQMTFEELMMMKQYHLNVKVLILNNQYLGMVRQWQELFNQRRYSFVDLHASPDFVKLAEAFDLPAMRISTRAELDAHLRDILTSDTGIVIDCRVAEEVNVFPMIPAGARVSNMVGKKGVSLHDE